MVQSSFSLYRVKMEFSVREELIILTSCFCFCMFAIPIMIFNAKSTSHRYPVSDDNNSANLHSDLDFQRKLLVDSVEILENLNRDKNNNDPLVELADLLGLSEVKFQQKYGKVLRKGNLTARKNRRIVKKIWNNFGFSSKNILKGSLKLPLVVDW